MRTFAIPANAEDEKKTEQEIRDFVRQWVDLLAGRKFAEALALLSPDVPSGSGSVDTSQAAEWTPALLEAVIANYGTPEPWQGRPQAYAVVPLDASMRDAFETSIFISFDRASGARNAGLGGVDFDLPLNYPSGNAVGDLTARMLFKRVSTAEMALVLLDIHVL